MTAETSFEQVVEERLFAGLLQTNSEVFFRLSNTLQKPDRGWNRKHYFQLISESDALESFLDDYGARLNRTYAVFGELVASVRGFAMAGYSTTHLTSRLESYGIADHLAPGEFEALERALGGAVGFIRASTHTMLRAIVAEAGVLGLEITPEAFPEENFLPVHARQRLPRNVDVEELTDERQKIAEVASKYLGTCDLLGDARVREIDDPEERASFLARACTEEKARVYEATVHNLQSAYDTYIKSTKLESNDERLPRLRGHVSTALHILEATTHLTHFYERHENDIRSEASKQRIAALVDRAEVQDVILNRLLYWAERILVLGRGIAEDLLGGYTNAQELRVELADDLVLHARPAALIVGIVNQFGTPVELEVGGQRCNAASILELLVTVGSHPDEKRFVFRGDEKPLRDIGLLFQYGLGEAGVDQLPDELAYLRAK